MIAVCGIGSPSGRLNRATTAYQSASPPMVAASANAATKPKAGCTGNSHLAPMKTAKVTASTSVASSFTRRSSAARAASPGESITKVLGRVRVIRGLRTIQDPHPEEPRERRLEGCRPVCGLMVRDALRAPHHEGSAVDLCRYGLKRRPAEAGLL